MEEGLILKWYAPLLPFRQKNTTYYLIITVSLLAILSIIVFNQELLFFALILACLFLYYTTLFVKFDNVEYLLTEKSLIINGRQYLYSDLDSFSFSKRWQYRILTIKTKLKSPDQLIVVINPSDEEKIRRILQKKLGQQL